MSLHEAAREGNVESVRQLVSADAEAVNERDKHSRTPLHIAAWAGQEEVVKVLCDANADVGASAQDDMAAIHFASQKGHTEVVRTLLLAGAYVNARNRKGMSPLHFAVQGSYAELVKLLVRKGANLESENKAKKKPIDLIRDETLRSVIKEAEIERNNRRAKSKDKVKQQAATGKEMKGNEAEEAHVTDTPDSAVSESRADAEKTQVEDQPRVDEEENGNEEDENVVIGPQRKKARVELTHLFGANDEDEVD
ncbi:hypothetical protein R1sor_017026 [Riccia sorocarpa]|uniref:Uncharacterized protein n=1 Tax=Riccia sorocarpa TaxID=122646 RepID=A0ABD3IBT6_9MARC